MLTVFVDESGDLGQRGERYFIIVVVAPQKGKRIHNLIRHFCAQHNIKEVHAAQLTFKQKQEIFNKLTSANDYAVSYIVADKKHIDNQQLFRDKNLLYNYLFSFLIKKTIKGANEDVCVLLDNHSIKTKSINSLCDYIKIKAFTQWNFQHTLHIQYTDSKHSKIVQVADIIANAIYAHYVYGKGHFYNMLTISEAIEFPIDRFGK